MTPASEMPFNEVVKIDGAHYVKKFFDDEPGKPVRFDHNLGKKPTEITVVWCNKSIQYPEVESETSFSVVLKFIPEWISTYTSKKFIVVMRFR